MKRADPELRGRSPRQTLSKLAPIARVGSGFALLFATFALFAACARDRASPQGDTTPAGTANLGPRAEFEAIADRILNGSNEMLGRGSIDELGPMVASSDPATRLGREVRMKLGREMLRMGSIDEAIPLLDEAVASLERDPNAAPEESEIIRLRGLAHLRKAEIENCVNRHNRDCCIAPLEGGGVHRVSDPARRARDDYLAYLERIDAPGNNKRRIAATWLLNIACMALDEYPEGVPKKYLVPESAFASEYDIGRFIDIASDLGIDTFNHAGGAIVDDLDGDGLYDIVTSNLWLRGPMRAHRNRGDGTFEDAASSWGLDQQLGGLHIAGADYDNDGDLDILVPRGAWMMEDGQIRKSLLRNDGASGFADVTRAAGVEQRVAPTQAVVWADFDNDGHLDLYVGNESRAETMPGSPNIPSQLYRNRGDGTFVDVAAEAGVTNDRYTKGAAAGDYDDDGDMDLYVSNLEKNRLYRNDGGMRFVDVAPALRLTEPDTRSFACWFFDFDNDADLDIWVNAYDAMLNDVAASAMGLPQDASPPCLYRNEGDGTFTDVAKQAGIGRAWLPMGCSFGDFDNDGWLDVYLGTGEPRYESLMPNIALRNDHGRRFQDVTRSGGLGHLQKGHGVSFADLDGDGDQDIFHQIGGLFPGDAFRNALFLNPGHGNHFVTIDLVGVTSNRQGIGARIAVTCEGPEGLRTFHRAAGSISSFGQAPRRQEIGLGRATGIRAIEIWWPASGERQRFEEVPLDSHLRVTEGVAKPEVLPRRLVPLKAPVS